MACAQRHHQVYNVHLHRRAGPPLAHVLLRHIRRQQLLSNVDKQSPSPSTSERRRPHADRRFRRQDTVKTTEPFTITATLNDSSNKGIPHQTIRLDQLSGAHTFSPASLTLPMQTAPATSPIRSLQLGRTSTKPPLAVLRVTAPSNSAPITVNVTNRASSQLLLGVFPASTSGKFASGQPFFLNGSLTSGGTGIPNAPVNLQYSLDQKTWSTASAPTTTGNGTPFANGSYTFSGSVAGKGLYYFRSVYGGNVNVPREH